MVYFRIYDFSRKSNTGWGKHVRYVMFLSCGVLLRSDYLSPLSKSRRFLCIDFPLISEAALASGSRVRLGDSCKVAT